MLHCSDTDDLDQSGLYHILSTISFTLIFARADSNFTSNTGRQQDGHWGHGHYNRFNNYGGQTLLEHLKLKSGHVVTIFKPIKLLGSAICQDIVTAFVIARHLSASWVHPTDSTTYRSLLFWPKGNGSVEKADIAEKKEWMGPCAHASVNGPARPHGLTLLYDLAVLSWFRPSLLSVH